MTLILFGSPHPNGHTASLLHSYLSEMKLDPSSDAVFFFNAYTTKIEPCVGCALCKVSGKCQYNDLDLFYETLAKSDHIIIASPVYNASFPSPLKAALDRLQPFYYKQCGLKEKPVTALLSSGSGGSVWRKAIKQQLDCLLWNINGKLLEIRAIRDVALSE